MIARAALLALLLAAVPAQALEYRVTGRAAPLYDAPSRAAGKVALAGPGLPLEVVIDTDAWVKVRTHDGRLAWMDKTALGGPKTVMVKVEASVARARPSPDADGVFRAARGVLLEVTGPADAAGWLPVRHAEGLAGWLPAHEVWGE